MSESSSRARSAFPESEFAFQAQRAEPLDNAGHVRNAIARFDQVEGISDAERDAAWERIQAAAARYGMALHEAGWRGLAARHAGIRSR